MRPITASQIKRVRECPGSLHLPNCDDPSAASDRGTAIHKYLENVARYSKPEALEKVPQEYRQECDAINLDGLPLDWNLCEYEYALAYDTVAGTAYELPRFVGRGPRYERLDATREIGITMDVCSWKDDLVQVADYKTGWDVGDPASNDQLLAGAVAINALHGPFESFRVGIFYIEKDGETRHEFADLALEDIRAYEQLLRGLVAGAAALKPGEGLNVGDHCRFCPSKRSCPKYNSALVSLGQGAGLEPEGGSMLAPSQVGALYLKLATYQELMKEAERRIVEYVRQAGEVPLPNGKKLVIGQTQQREYVDGEAAWKVLKQVFGGDVANAAMKPSTSKQRIQEALKEAGFSKSKIDTAMGRLRSGGAFRLTRTSEKLVEVKP